MSRRSASGAAKRCEQCGEMFPVPTWPSHQRQRFCGMKCFGLSKVKPETVICPQCGGAKAWSSKHCQACWAKGKRTGVATPCPGCGAEVYRSPAQWKASARRYGAFCSRACFGKFYTGSKNGAFVDGTGCPTYPGSFDSARRAALRREGSRCFLCKVKGTKGTLDVHHIDRHTANNEPHNLVALCRPCHMEQRHATKERTLELAEQLSRLLSEAYGYEARSITLRWKETTTTSPTAS